LVHIMDRASTLSNRPTGTQAITRAVSILKSFSDAHPRWRVTDLSRELGLTKPTIVRLLHALEHEGMVMRDGAGTYALGPGAIALGTQALRSNDLRTVARVELETLAAQTGETVTLEVLTGDDVLILDEVRARQLLGTRPDIGTRWPVHATSTGKVFLAFADAAARRAVPARLDKLTKRTVTSGARLRKELATVAEQGYATAEEELVEGYVAVAAPIRDHDGNVIAALSVGGPSVRMASELLPRLGKQVREAADRVSRKLGAR
jgi:IclR family transcriptional regulator, acetate operon repressor